MKRAGENLAAILRGALLAGLVAGVASTLSLSATAQTGAPKKPAVSAGKGAPKAVKLRDPFQSLVRPDEESPQGALPPGIRGLVIQRLTLNGIIAGQESIAVVTMRGRNRAYFLRKGDQLYDGFVSDITEDGVVFKERSTDAFGTPYEREVTKQISGSGANR